VRADISGFNSQLIKEAGRASMVVFRRAGYGVPRKLKCAGCQVGDHCNGANDGCYCECTDQRV
jgi:hypothetical protein